MEPRDRSAPKADAVFAVLAASPSAVVAIAEDETIAFVTDPAAELFRWNAEDLLGLPIRTVTPSVTGQAEVAEADPEPTPGVDLLQRLQSRLEAVQGDLMLERRDGTLFPAEVVLTQLETEAQLLVAARVEDLSLRRAQERRLLDLNRSHLSLVEMYQAIVRAPDATVLMDETCRIAVEQAGYRGAWIAGPDEHGVLRPLASAGGIEDLLAQFEMSLDVNSPHGRGPTARALREGRPAYSAELEPGDIGPELRRLVQEHDIWSSATLPLRRDGRTVAVLSLYSSRPDFFDASMRTLLEAVSQNVSLALERFVVADRLRAIAAERRDLSRRLVDAQEQERARIAADVHDDSVQSLAAVDLRLGLLLRQTSEVAPELVPGLEAAQATVGLVSRGLRDLLFALEAADTDRGLPEILADAAAHVFEDTDVECELRVDSTGWDGSSQLSRTDRGQALRIAKEALFNARRHAQPRHVVVAVVRRADGIEVTVADDGVGFDIDSVQRRPGHRGLANMHDRAEVVGGWCRVERGVRGTTVRFWMPYADDEPS